jgi:branched-chain amino acid aminotransferase
MQYINYNGTLHPENEPLMPVTNRGFKYGDSFFETMVMFGKKLPLIAHHWLRIEFTAEALGMKLPKRLTIESLLSMVLDLASVNEATENARIRLQFFRKGGGLYLPEEEEMGYVISMDRIENKTLEVGKGLTVGVRADCYKTVSMTSDLKTSNALMYVMAAQLAKTSGWDECILLSNIDSISEAISSNVFLIKGDKVITPDLDSGCVNGVMRSVVISLLEDGVLEEREVHPDELMAADEILLTNAVRGIQWVRLYNDKTYSNKKALELTSLLNQALLSG